MNSYVDNYFESENVLSSTKILIRVLEKKWKLRPKLVYEWTMPEPNKRITKKNYFIVKSVWGYFDRTLVNWNI